MAVKVFRSDDTNAPTLWGALGSLIDVLDACLVNGYGATRAGGTVTISANPGAGNTVTIGSSVYQFVSSLTGSSPGDVLIGASATATALNLIDAINKHQNAGTTFNSSTPRNNDAYAPGISGSTITITARVGGSGGNSIALAATSGGTTVSGSTLTGGTGSNSISSAGWSKPYTANNKTQAVYRPGSGIQHYFHVDDNAPSAAVGKEAQFRGSEAATGFQAATNYFPTTSQIALASGLSIRKTTDNSACSWIVVADDRTCYIFILTRDTSGVYFGNAFGEFYSIYNGTDLYRSFVCGRTGVNSGLVGGEHLCDINLDLVTQSGHYLSRSYTAIGGAVAFGKFGDWQRARIGGAAAPATMGTTASGANLAAPNPVDGNLHISPVHVNESGNVRGRMRGFYHICHAQSAFTDGDTITGSGPYAGRTFLIIKQGQGVNTTAGCYCMEITGPWESN